MEKIIQYFGQPAKVGCDEKCEKAWGRNRRPKNQLSDNPDDYEMLSDDELGVAPVDPGTTEGGDRKPIDKHDIPNKWCIRECERCAMSMPGDHLSELPLYDFTKRIKNITEVAN
jgi:hypothetical protein